MGTAMTYRVAAGAAVLLTVASLAVGFAPAAAQAAAPAACVSSATVKEKLPNGTTWQMCWHMDALAGLVLDKVYFSAKRSATPVQVLESLRLGQLNVPYDSGETEFNDVTDYGFGGDNTQTLTGDDCKGGSARKGSDGGPEAHRRTVLCVSAESSGLAYRLNDEESDTPKVYSKQGFDLVLRSISKVGWYEYVSEYRLGDAGQISARLGATGDLSPADYVKANDGWPVGKGAKDYAAMHYHNAFWRVDFNIGGAGKEKVEQYDTKVSGRGPMGAKLITARTSIAKEGSFTKANRRWWRLVSSTSKNADGHLRSYQLVTGANDVYEAHPETTPDVSFTQYHACERFATGNADPQCPHAKTILDFAKNKETMTNPIMWVRVGFHHVPRDEDQSPMPLHWQGFDLMPRDFTAINPAAPDGRQNVNGQPS
jgi:primary-amine oxidase